MVDIDKVVVDSCKSHLSGHHKGAFDDPRLQLVIGDAESYIRETTETFDVIVMDLPDPIDGGPCWRMYTKEFYEIIRDRLNPGGVFVSQSGPSSPYFAPKVFSPVQHTLRTTFTHVRPYSSYIPSSLDTIGYTLASNDVDLALVTPALVDHRLKESVIGVNDYYDGETHSHMFSLPRTLRRIFAEETRIGTLADPQCFLKSK
jgi:spermidine synthase